MAVVPLGCGGEAVEPHGAGGPDPLPPGPPRAFGVILSDPALCAGCARCAITCSSLNLGGPSGHQALIGPDPLLQAMQFTSYRWMSATCHQCPETYDDQGDLVSPWCVAACPHGAARIAPLGDPTYGDTRVRFIDQGACLGCGLCHEACPYSHPLVREGLATRKCDLCVGRWGSPPCVDQCPSSALSWVVPWDDDLAAVGRPFPWVSEGDEGQGSAEEGLGGSRDTGWEPGEEGG